MEIATISPKYQVVIPQKIRESFGLRSGEKVQVIAFKERIEIIPIRDIKTLRGMAKGMTTAFERPSDRV